MSLKEYDNFKVKDPYYNGYNLLSKLDRNGEKPEIYISTSNRSAGKTMFHNGNRVHKFLQNGEKTLLLYRNKYESENCAETFFHEIGKTFFPMLVMKQETIVPKVLWRLSIGYKLDETGDSFETFGYSTALSASGQIKKCSHLANDVDCILMDEFQQEDGRYLKDEVAKLQSIHDSLARGNGEQARYLPVILIGNLIDLYNPYYEALDVVDAIQIQSNFYRGEGFVIEQGFNEASAKSHKQSAFHRAFTGSSYNNASEHKQYINTSYQFIDNSIADIGCYLLTIKYDNKLYSVRYNEQAFFYYVSDKPDPNFRYIHAARKDDISDGAVFDPTGRYREVLSNAMHSDRLRFKNLKCKKAALHFIMKK